MAFSEKQLEILRFPTTEYEALICDGAVRSGKTSIMSLSFILWAMDCFDRCNFAFCGKSVGSVERNIIRPLLAIQYLQEEFELAYTRSDHTLIVRRGKKENTFYLFGGKDESSYALIQGITLAGALLDEVVLMPESFVNQALARCSVDGAKLWFSCNPGNPQHWFKTEWIDQAEEHNALYLHFEMTDNPSLSEKTLARYKLMFPVGVFYDRYIRGLWVAAEGLVYPMFDREKHTFTEPSLPLRAPKYISIDYGTMNPFAMGLWIMLNGEAEMLKEYYYDGRECKQQKTDEEYYQDLEKFAEGHAIDRVIVDPSAASFIECIRRHGKFNVVKANNSVLDGIRLTGSLLQAGKLRFHESCVNTFVEFGAYVWGDEAGEDAVIKENDHAMDMIRYFCMTIMRREIR